MKGIIVDISKDLYYVRSDRTYICKARGLFRNKNLSPMVGDNVEIEVLDENNAHITKVFERKNKILRPPVSNIDQAIIVFSLIEPEISLKVIDRYIMYYEIMHIPIVLCLNKIDLISDEEVRNLYRIYSNLGYKVIVNSINDVDESSFKDLCRDKISVITGPSGVGKSTILNTLNSDYNIWVGEISNKTKRGKHTTRAATLYEIFENSYIIDTAGFTSLDITKFVEDESQIRNSFVEFLGNDCKFANCKHINEPNCSVKAKIDNGEIEKSRYESYIYYLNEFLKNRRY